MTKTCNKCKLEKSDNDFFFRDKSNNKRHNLCKECYGTSRRGKEHYLKYKDEYVARAMARNAIVRDENFFHLMDFLSGKKCVDCGESDIVVFEFDHRDPSIKKYTVSRMLSKALSWKTILTEIDKCDIICANCHKRRTAKQFGWRKMTGGLGGKVLVCKTN